MTDDGDMVVDAAHDMTGVITTTGTGGGTGGVDGSVGVGTSALLPPPPPVKRLSSSSSSSSSVRAYSEVIAPRFTEITPITR